MKSTKKKINLIFTIIFFTILIVPLFIGGVSATWNYNKKGNPCECTPLFTLGAWSYNKDEIKDSISDKITEGNTPNPIDDPEAPPLDPVGMNNPNSALSQIVEKRKINGFDSFSSVDKYNESNIRAEMGLTQDEDFILKFPQNEPNKMYLYTTTVKTGKNAIVFGSPQYYIPVGERIYPVYRHILVKNDQGLWTTASTEIGSAEVGAYKSRVIGSFTTDSPIFVPETWKKEKCGISKDKPIILYYGQVYNYSLNNKLEKTHFIIHGDGGTYTISANDPNVSINIYDMNNNIIVSNTNSASFSSTVYNDYHIIVYGSTNITLTISE